MDNNPKQQVIDRLKQANNVLVTVRSNPSVDQLSACIGLTIMLNKIGKHGTAVFSGVVPSTIEFLKPQETLEKNTDSLRDFIIALDKSKADKLRYKVEDKVVKIFITPYKTSISEKDLDFSQGDFNIDVIVALGVQRQQDLDQAITSHGRILHDATVISVNNTNVSQLGSINWVDTGASSLSELVAQLDGVIGKSTLDAQISTALLTGIVAETDRFSNAKTTSLTMSVSSKLIANGANQQLVATKLEKPPEPPPQPAVPPTPNNQPPSGPSVSSQPQPTPKDSTPPPKANPNNDGTIEINHQDQVADSNDSSGGSLPVEPQIRIDEEGTLHKMEEEANKLPTPPSSVESSVTGGSPLIVNPPSLGGRLTANSVPEALDPATDPLSLPTVEPPLLSRDSTPVANNQQDSSSAQLTPTDSLIPSTPPLQPLDTNSSMPDLGSARDAVAQAASNTSSQPLEPIAALNAQPIFSDLQSTAPSDTTNTQPSVPGVPPLNNLSSSTLPSPGQAYGTQVAPNAQSVSAPADQSLHTLDMPNPSMNQSYLGDSTASFNEDLPSGLPASNPLSASQDSDNPPPVPPPIVPSLF